RDDGARGPVELTVHDALAAVHEAHRHAAPREPARDLDPQHSRADDDGVPGVDRRGDDLARVVERAQRVRAAGQAARLVGEAGDVGHAGGRARGEHDDVVRVRALAGDDAARRAVDRDGLGAATDPYARVVGAGQPDGRDVDLPRDDLAEEHAVVRLVLLGAEDRDLHRVPARGVVPPRREVAREPRPDHAVADHDDPRHPGTSCSTGARRTSTAHTLNSGMPETGSVASVVTRLTLPSPLQWKGMKTVSGRTASVHRATASIVPRRVVRRARSPSPTPSRSPRTGCSSTNASGTTRSSSGTRRVWAPDW